MSDITDSGGKFSPGGRGTDAASRNEVAVYDVACPATRSPTAVPLALFDPVEAAAVENDKTFDDPVDEVPDKFGGTIAIEKGEYRRSDSFVPSTGTPS